MRPAVMVMAASGFAWRVLYGKSCATRINPLCSCQAVPATARAVAPA